MNHKLPVLRVFTEALYLLWMKRGFAAALGWPVILLSGLLGLGLDMDRFALPFVGASNAAGDSLSAKLTEGVQLALVYAGLQFVLLSMVAVYWHRNILLQKTRTPLLPLRADGAFWRYIGKAIRIFLIMIVFFLAVFLAGMFKATLSQMLVPAGMDANAAFLFDAAVFAIIAVVMLTVIFRVSLALPAAAIGHTDFGLKTAWRETRGNSLRILVLQMLALLVGAGVTAAETGMLQAVEATLGTPPQWFKLGLNAAANFLYVLFAVGLLSLTYAYITNYMPPQDARMDA